jgi:hypothetical protein
MDKFNKLPGVLKYNHTEHKPEALIDQLRVLMNKKASALVVSGIHGDEPAGDKAAQKLKGSADVVSDINPSDKRRFEGKDINRHFDKPTEGKVQKTILDIIRKKKPSKVIALHEDNEVDKPYAYSSESLKDDTREALKEYSTASSAHGDKTEDGVISEGKNPPDGSLEKALDDRDIPRVTLETPSKTQDIDKRVETQLDVVKKLLSKKADLANTQPAMSGGSALQATHRPVNMQTSTSTLKQVTPVDHEAYDNAFRAGAKNFLTAQTADTITFGAGKVLKPIRGEVAKGVAAKINKGENTMQAMTTLGAGELAAQNADNPKDKNKERLKNYGLGLAASAISLYPPAAGALYAGQTVNNLYDAANVYNKYLEKNPPRQFAPIMTGQAPMRPEYNVSIPLSPTLPPVPAPAPVDFRITQPNVRYQQASPNVNISTKLGEDRLDINKRVETQLGVVRKLLGKKADLANTQPAKRGQIELDKIAAFIGSRPGLVANFPARTIPSPNVGDRIGSLLMGKNYIPSPIDGESMYDAMLRSDRNADMLEVSKNTFGNNPLFHRLGLNKGRLAPLLGIADYMTQGKLSSILSPINGGNTYQANKNIQEMLSNPSIMSQFKQASSNQPLLPGMKQWSKKQPFNYAEDAYKRGRIPKHVRDDIVSGRAAEEFRPKFKEMLESIERSRRKN